MITTLHQTRRLFLLLLNSTLPLLLMCGVHEWASPPSAWGLDPEVASPSGDRGAEPAAPPTELERRTDLIRARILDRRGLVPETLSLYRSLRVRFPEDREIWLDLIQFLSSQGMYEASRQELNAFLDQYPGDAGALRIKARIFFEQGRFESSYPVYDLLVEASPEDAWIWSDYGNARQGAGDWAGALDCFSRALELDPENLHALRSVHRILRDHLPRLDAGFRSYSQKESGSEWATWFLRYGRHLTEKTWWTFSYDRIRMDRPEGPFVTAVSETLHDASLLVDYEFNRYFTGRAGAGFFSGMGDGARISLGVEGRPRQALVLRADYAHGLPWYDPMEAVVREGRENRLTLTGTWSGWSPWTVYLQAYQSDFEVRDLRDYGRRQGALGVLSRRFGDNPFVVLSYSYSWRQFEYSSGTYRPVAVVERERAHGVSAMFEHRPSAYWTYRLTGGVRRDTARDLDSWFIKPEALIHMGNRVEGRFSFEHSSETGTVTGGASRTIEAGIQIMF